MAKRVSRRLQQVDQESARVHSLFFDKPRGRGADLPDDRDQRYLAKVRPRSDNQRMLMESIERNALTVALGPAGTGKTYLAIIAKAVEALEAGKIARIVLSRPAVEAGENLGYPAGRHARQARALSAAALRRAERPAGRQASAHLFAEGTIEIAPVAFMRGRTLNNAFVVIDEAQNCTYGQLKMLLTRLGWHSTMVVTGDPDQTDLLAGMSGLDDIGRRLDAMDDVSVVRLTDKDVVRHPLVGRMLSVL